MSESRKTRIDPAIIAALIGVCGTVTVTVISLLAPRLTPQPTPFPTAPVVFTSTSTTVPTPGPTDTVPPGEPTSTPAPDTPTPLPTATLPPVGMDWINGCISALWKPYPTSIQPNQVNGCLVQPVDKFYTGNGRLAFTYCRLFGQQVAGSRRQPGQYSP